MTSTMMESLSVMQQRLVSSSGQDEKDPRSVYLNFYIDPQTPILVSMKNIQEVTVLPSRLLTTMPNMPPYILGLTNRRSQVVWVIDISQMIGLTKMSFIPPKIDIIVIKVGGFSAALAVHKIEGTVRISPEEINIVPGHLAPTLIPYLQGCVLKDKKISLVLDVEAIAQSSLLQGE